MQVIAPKSTGTDNRFDLVVRNFRISALRRFVDVWPRVGGVRVEHHWWNGDVRLARRDVYVRTDGELWEVEAQMGGPSGKSKVQQCPGKASALILADAWRGPRWQWRKL
jgi:hypothetical protein